MKSNTRRALLLITLFTVVTAAACEQKKERLVSRVLVTGEADARTPPDTAVVVLSVVTQNARAVEAQQQNARKSEAVIRAVREVAGANPEVQTSDYSLEPRRTWEGSLPRIIGYEARNTVTITTAALDSVGAVLDAGVQAGANSVERVAFTLRESNKARAETLAEASKQAMAKAQAMAAALGGRVVRVIEEQEGGFQNRPTSVGDSASTANAYAGSLSELRGESSKMSPRTPLEAGPLNVRSQVQLIVEIEAPGSAVGEP